MIGVRHELHEAIRLQPVYGRVDALACQHPMPGPKTASSHTFSRMDRFGERVVTAAGSGQAHAGRRTATYLVPATSRIRDL